MSRELKDRHRMRRSTLAGIIAACLVLAVLAGAVWWQRGQAFWTDGRTTRLAVGEINVRDVLWTRPAKLELPAGKDQVESDQAYDPSISPDGMELYFVRGKPGTGSRIFVSHRRGLNWSEPVAVDAINGKFDVLGPRVTADGKYLLFSSNRPGGIGGYDIWASPRLEGKSGPTWGEPFNLGPGVNSEFNEYNPDPTPDGQHLIFATNRKAASREQVQAWQGTIRQSATADYDLWMATIESAPTTAPSTPPSTQPAKSLAFREAAEIPNVNTPFTEGASCMSPAGDFLYFASNRPGGYGKFDIYRSRFVRGEFLAPENLGPSVNSDDNDADPALGLDGFRLYFSSDRGNQRGSYELFSSDSREVFTERLARPLPRIGWSLGSLLLSAAILVPLILLLHGTRNRKLSVLQRCMILSLIVHAGAAFLFSFVIVTQEVRRYARQGGGGTVNLNLGTPADVAVGFAVRGQFSVDKDAINAGVAAESAMPVQARVAREDTATAAPLDIAMPQVPTSDARARTAAAASAVADPIRTPRTIQLAGAPKEAMNGLFDPGAAIAGPDVNVAVPVGRWGQVTQAEANVEPGAAKVTATKVAAADFAAPRASAIDGVGTPATPTAPRPAESGLTGPAGSGSRPLLLSTSGGASVGGFNEPSVAAVNTAPIGAISRSAKRITGNETRTDETAATATDRLPISTTRAASIGGNIAPSGDAGAAALTPSTAGPATRPTAQTLGAIALAPTATTRPTSVIAGPVPAETLGVTQPLPAAIGPQVAIAPTAVRAARSQAKEDAAPAPAPIVDAARSTKLATATGVSTPTNDLVNDLTPLPKSTAPTTPAADAEGPTLATATYRPTAPEIAASSPAAAVAPITPAGSLGPGPIIAGESPFPRSKPQREANLKKRGGTDESEAAVVRGLAYIAQAQQPDGRWTHMLDGENPTHRENTFPHDSACTGLALLAMLAHDNTPDADGPYRDAVRRGLEFLLSIQAENGDLRGRAELRGGGPSRADMYDHAIATFAMGEAALMSRDKRYADAAVKGARFIVAAQDPRSGGWRYTPREYGDSSVFGWQIMALHTAEQLGFQIPDETRHGAARYLQLCAQGGHRTLAGYQPGHGPTAAMTAELLYSRMLLGERLDQDDLADAVGFLTSQPADPQNPDLYCCYYGSLCLVQTQGDSWKQWNERVRDSLIRLQQREAPLAGSWDTDLRWGNQGGRVFTTSLAVLTLEVYYRYLPLQPRADEK